MNKEDSLALYEQGRDAWNAWAEDMLRQRQALADSGVWPAGDEPSEEDAVREWCAAAKADFSGHEFADANFSGFVFPDDVDFGRTRFTNGVYFRSATFTGETFFADATFTGDTQFVRATLKGEATFWRATFEKRTAFEGVTFEADAWFTDAAFEGRTKFESVVFEGCAWFGDAVFAHDAFFEGANFADDAWFSSAIFKRRAWFVHALFERFATFTQTTFTGDTDFRSARFLKVAVFEGLQAHNAFDLADAIFRAVPSFNQANFIKAPRLNNLKIEHSRGWHRDNFHGDRELENRWQALRQIAIQAHDHEQEQIFFKEEIKARRGVIDKWWHGAYLAGWLFQIFADFGRSVWRPVLWWVASFPFFAALYLWRSPAFGKCVSGDGDPAASAFTLAIRNGLLFASGVFSEKLPQTYACLYGVGEVAGRTVPLVPGWTTAFGALQVVVSAVLIFLILLALRNRFRIR